VPAVQQKKPYKGIGMEGLIAKWYSTNRGKSLEPFRKTAREIADQLPSGAAVLEVAPGPGFLAIELAKLGPYHIVGLDISRSLVRIATQNAKKAGVDVAFRVGNASAMPLDSDSFDFIYCEAAFKNFSEPVRALDEMYRVLKPGGKAEIYDLRSDAPPEAIEAVVKAMGLGWLNTLITKWVFRHMLLKRAYSQEDFRRMAGQTPFKTCTIRCDLIGVTVSLNKARDREHADVSFPGNSGSTTEREF
jgi:ubiquinone/menaquinone biosynthesis C-methylase UbiE